MPITESELRTLPRNVLRDFSDEELAWDFHCNIERYTRAELVAEAHRRGVDLCRIYQARRGGAFVPGMKHSRGPCGGNCEKS
jgi:hypothetical protein